ncbi:glycoside hydrolase family 3 protein [Trichoderma virens Gv29-8]|uniref:Beta-glucosidase cel3A n=1 Tax=Hypocrea virens (strain Gv29-8 / FGSC 10586) TaxID=413071 RepID=G9MUU2_HYPVG|nr:glycoside hydrolase family 3 protein [Trichoderma virens Gv29-8]EHK21802.1 glycoside hydrolase family 3 protein [Trichoderma virens Gv29-8]UKZ52891.1 hypothetical protein TrVGV298_006678 [Trichoderma virens]
MKLLTVCIAFLSHLWYEPVAAEFDYIQRRVIPSRKGGWADAFHQAKTLVSRMSVEDKISLVTGVVFNRAGCVGNINAIDSIHFPGLCIQDGPLSLRNADLVSTFPAGVTTAATWDRALIYARGKALAAEFRGKGAHVLIGPVAGPLGRHPLGGRNWEGFSPDPYLTGVAASYSIRGIQDGGVQACIKHLIGYEQETQRSNTVSPNGTEVAGISSNIDDRTMHELYLWPFADAVRSGVASVMCSYNRVNETYSCENSKLLNGLLKTELGFQGYVVSDWFGTHSGVKSILSGLDMNMPGPLGSDSISQSNSYFGQNLTWAIANSSIPESRLDDMAHRILTPYLHLGQNKAFPAIDPSNLYVLLTDYGISPSAYGLPPAPPARDVRGDHKDLIRQIGAAGVVLLKNTHSTLPLKNPENIGLFGYDAADVSDGVAYQGTATSTPEFGFKMGTLSVGGGSGSARNTYVVSPLQAIRNRTNARLQYILNNEFILRGDFSSIFPEPDVCLVFLKTWSEESRDRVSFENDYNSTLVVEKVASFCSKTVVITHSSGVNTLPWAKNPNVTAILAAHYPGQESGNSIVDILFGDINPSGRLPYTIPIKEGDYGNLIVNISGSAAYDSSAWQSNFTEGLLIDYRHFDANSITPLYEFGFGLSYTTFELQKPINVKAISAIRQQFPNAASDTVPGGNPSLFTELFEVTTSVKNTGSVDGASVVQLYVSFNHKDMPANTPVKVLRGFEKINLQPQSEAFIKFSLTRRDLSFWNVTAQDWQLPLGIVNLLVGFSSRDIRQARSIRLF